MAAIAYPHRNLAPRRPVAGKRRSFQGDRLQNSHLRLLREPLFADPIFAELEASGEFAESESPAWHPPPPVIARREVVMTFPRVAPLASRHLPSHASPLRFAPLSYGASAKQSALPAGVTYAPRRMDVRVNSHAERPISIVAPRYRLRRFVSCVILGVALFGGLSAASAIADAHQGSPTAIAGSVPVAGGYRYTVRVGDTLWSIATRVFPNGDPRALVTQLGAQIKSMNPIPGEHLLLP
ncbi:MAG TPA: LysM domain-containing protein [Acidimicrobiales bacterium]|nr:LysM domain-containing protein [Acidimicrobiales bacterium]